MALPIKFLRNFPGMSRRLPSRSRREERIVLADVRGKIFKGAYSNYMHWLCNPIRKNRALLWRGRSVWLEQQTVNLPPSGIGCSNQPLSTSFSKRPRTRSILRMAGTAA